LIGQRFCEPLACEMAADAWGPLVSGLAAAIQKCRSSPSSMTSDQYAQIRHVRCVVAAEAEARAIVNALHGRGIPPTTTEVGKLMEKSGYMRRPSVKAAMLTSYTS
jgi:hypothetical protein